MTRLALRTALWLITDEKYKAALFNFLKKKGENVYSVEDPEAPAVLLARRSRCVFVQPPRDAARSSASAGRSWRASCRRGSRRTPQLFDSEVRITADKVDALLRVHRGQPHRHRGADVRRSTSRRCTRAEDGQLLENSRDFYAPTEARLPDDAQLRQAVDDMVGELLALRDAPAIDPYTGPAILEPEAAGVLFHEAVGHRLEGDRQDNDSRGQDVPGPGGQAGAAGVPVASSMTRRARDGRRASSTATTCTTRRA